MSPCFAELLKSVVPAASATLRDAAAGDPRHEAALLVLQAARLARRGATARPAQEG